MMQFGKTGTASRTTRLLALAFVLSGCVAGSGVVHAATWGEGEDVIITANESLAAFTEADSVTINSGILTVGGTGGNDGTAGRVHVLAGDVKLAGGGLVLSGDYGGISSIYKPGQVGERPDSEWGNFIQSGGDLKVGVAAGTPALMEFGTATFTGGTATIACNARSSGGPFSYNGGWKSGSIVWGYKGVEVSGNANVTVGTNGMIGTTTKGGHDIDITGGTVILAGGTGSEAILFAGANRKLATDAGYGKLNIGTGGKVNVTDQGVFVARETNLAGTITVSDGKKLTVVGTADTSSANDVLASLTSGEAKQWGAFNFAGGTLTNGGIVDFTAAKMDVNVTTGDNTLTGNLVINENAAGAAAGNTYATNLTVNGGNLDVKGSATVTKGNVAVIGNGLKAASLAVGSDAAAIINVTDNGYVTIAGDTSVAGGSINVTAGSLSSTGNTTVTGGSINVADGSLYSKDLTVSTGSVNIAGAQNAKGSASLNLSGNLSITSGAVNINTSSDASEIAGNVSVANGAKLNVTSGALTVDGGLTVGPTAAANTVNIGDGGSMFVTKDTTLSGAATGAVDVYDGGLFATTAKGFIDTTDVTDLQLTAAATDSLSVAGDGTVSLTYVGANGAKLEVKKAQYDKLIEEFADAQGGATLNLHGFTFIDSSEVIVDKDGIVDDDLGSGSGDDIGLTVTDIKPGVDTITVTGEVDGAGITVSGSGSNQITTIDAKDDVTLVGGSSNGVLIGTEDGDTISLTAEGNVTVGSTNNVSGNQGGAIGDLTLSSSDAKQTVSVNNGTLTVDDIAVVPGSTADINVELTKTGSQDTALNADSIDLSDAGGDVVVTAGKGTALNVVEGDLTLKAGSELNANEGAAITVEKGDIINAGAILADGGDITVKKGDIVGATTITAESGNITVAEGDVDVAGTVMADGGSISVGGDIVAGQLVVTDAKSEIEANDITVATSAGTPDIEVAGGSITADTLEIVGGNNVLVTIAGDGATAGAIDVGTFDMSGANGGIIEVGTGDKAASDGGQAVLVAQSADLAGTAVFSDPAWNTKDGKGIRDASAVIFGSVGGDGKTLNGSVIVGQNSFFAFGNGNEKAVWDWMEKYTGEVGSWDKDDITAAAALFKPLTIDGNSALIVDGSLADRDDVIGTGKVVLGNGTLTGKYTGGGAYFADGSLLLVDAAGIGNGTALTSLAGGPGGVLEVDEGARLHLVNAKEGDTYQITGGFAANSGTGVIGDDAWVGKDGILSFDVYEDGSDNVVVGVTRNDARDIYTDISSGAANSIDWVYGNNLNDTTDIGGVGFVSSAVEYDMLNGTRLASNTIEGAAQISALGGAQLTALNITRLNHNAIAQRFSFNSNPFGSGSNSCDTAFINDSVLGNGFAIWAGPVYQHARVSGMEVGRFDHDYKSNLGGANVGFDFTRGDNVRFGVMGSIGGGKNKSNGGEFAFTENKFDYYSISAFAGWSMNNISLLLDGGFTRVKNKVDQRSLGGALHTEPKVHAWDVGLTAEYMVDAGFMSVIPHAGIRYEGINTRDHNLFNRSSGDNIMKIEKETQHLLSIPVGVSFAKHIQICNWRISPFADVGALFTVGDRDYESESRLTGGMLSNGSNIPAAIRNNFKTKMVDSVAFDGSAGLNVDNGRFFGGFNYNITAGKNQTVHGFALNVGLNF